MYRYFTRMLFYKLNCTKSTKTFKPTKCTLLGIFQNVVSVVLHVPQRLPVIGPLRIMSRPPVCGRHLNLHMCLATDSVSQHSTWPTLKCIKSGGRTDGAIQ